MTTVRISITLIFALALTVSAFSPAWKVSELRYSGSNSQEPLAQEAIPARPAKPASPPSPRAIRAFLEAKDLIASREWEKAEAKLNEVISLRADGAAVDAALYYLAFVLKKQSRFEDAEKAIDQLLKEFPDSRWVGDAEAMRMEVAPDLGRGREVAEAARRANNVEVQI